MKHTQAFSSILVAIFKGLFTVMDCKQTLENGYQDGAESLGMLQFYLLVKLNILNHQMLIH